MHTKVKAKAPPLKKGKAQARMLRDAVSLRSTAPQHDTMHPRLTKTFLEEYAKLNTEQKRAVDTIEGPVMVVAGPGTGKTQVLALRTANILRKTQMRPSNILCLTFSVSGASAMRDRLRSLIGADAYCITVDTIHGFCNGIISSHPEVFEEWAALEQISDIERYRAMHRIIDELMPDCILAPRKAPYMRTKDILGRISQLKREGKTEETELREIAEAYEKIQAKKSKPETKLHEKNLRTARKFREFLDVFFRYQAMLERTGRYDYDDMILHVTKALTEEPWLLASLQERYQYILLDELQDTNGAQWQFLHLLTTDPTADAQPNFFVVGDDDQAIYRFQGANLQNILTFSQRFPAAPIITLQTSYRCSQPILDAASSLIAKNEERLVGTIPGIEKKLVARKNSVMSSGTGDTPVHIETRPPLLRPTSGELEPWLIAEIIEERIARGIPAQEIAILVQTNAELLPLYNVLRARKIPVELTGKLDLLTHPLVLQVITLLRAMGNPSENYLFLHALACDCFAIPAIDLANLAKASREKKKSIHDLTLELRNNAVEVPLVERDTLLSAFETVLDLHVRIPNRTIMETVERVLHECHLLPELSGSVDFDAHAIAAAQFFFGYVQARAYELPGYTLHQLLSDLEFYENPDYHDVRLTYDLPHLTEHGVQLMTAHKSKGLEFHTVIIPNFREGHWDRRRNPPSLSIPEDLLFGWHKEKQNYEQGQDERRVAYVAMTRAKEELIFTCPRTVTGNGGAKAVSPSGFFAEAGTLEEEIKEVHEPEKAATLLYPMIRSYPEETRAFLRKQIEEFALSATALHDFLEDPKSFFERHLLRYPQARNPSYAYGNAVHHVLAEWGLSRKRGESLELSMLLFKFKEHLSEREVLTKAERSRLEKLGEEALSRYYEQSLQGSQPIIHKVECELRAHLWDQSAQPALEGLGVGIPIKGKLDRIDLLEPGSARAIVYDYKTGKPATPAQIEERGYRIQLLFYDLLLRASLPLNPERFVLSFVGEEGEAPIEREFMFTEADRRGLTEIIRSVWGKIVALDFTKL